MYRNPSGFIVTQNPLSTTLVDFYRILYEKETTVLVSFDNEMVAEVQTFCNYSDEI